MQKPCAIVNLLLSLNTYIHTYIHTHIHTYIHTYRQTDRQIDRQTDIQTDRHTYIHTYIYKPVVEEPNQGFYRYTLDPCGGHSGAPLLVYVNYIRDLEGKSNELDEMTYNMA